MKSCIIIIAAMICSISGTDDDIINSKKRLLVCYRDRPPVWNELCVPYQWKYCSFNIHKNCTHVIVRSAGRVDPMTAYYKGIGRVGYFGYPFWRSTKIIQSVNPVIDKFNDGPQVVSSKIGRSRLMKSAIKILKHEHYDGLNVVVDEEYLNDITQLLMEMRPEFEKNNLLLTALFPATLEKKVDLSYIARNLDFISIKSFRDTKTGSVTMLQSPLYAEEGWSVDYSVNMYINMGVPREKILVGIPTFAVTHQLDHPDFNFLGANASKKGRQGTVIKEDGLLTLEETARHEEDGILVRDSVSDAPYLSSYFLWISYDDDTSVKAKVRYIEENGLGGVMLWPSEKYDASLSSLPFTNLINATFREGYYLNKVNGTFNANAFDN